MRRLTLALLLALVLVAPALAGDEQRKRSIDARIAHEQEQLDTIRRREASLRASVADVTSRIRSLEAQVGDVSLRLETLEQDLALHQERLDALTELFRLQTRRFETLTRQHALATERLNRRLVDIYESDDVSSLDVILGASSIQDALDKVAYLREIADQDDRIAQEVAHAKADVKRARARTSKLRTGVQHATRTIALRASQTREVRDELLGARSDLSAAKHEKLEDLSQLSAEERAEVAEIDALQEVSANLAAQIRAAQARAAAESSGRTAGTTQSAGGFMWPASGSVTSPFGWRWGRMHEGIDIGSSYGAPIVAAAAGTVIYCGWMGGYGNLVVIDHGGGVSTAYGHQSSIAVACGQGVAQGATIGYVGSTGHSTGPHLHFEVRVDGAPVDPLGYL